MTPGGNMNDIGTMQGVLDNNTGDFTKTRGKNHAKRIYGRIKRKGGDPHNVTVHVGGKCQDTAGADGHISIRPTHITDESGTTIHTF